ncbi:Biotin--[methylcrotonoyl-CoA-carboxylase] ligase protein [Dioscorea alata]|uniref:Biotin--[methylcrotonoyl-CoA-carboxylase] ligase protein n=1 Tax=Dioscorea alata TaxID=55571 RepID=A0ACB7U2D2_DIOAL|nr:Biotin--[methylcrotonoyl-CoA-carboxylase] ligase protein [Dioscorea alata]
MLLILPHFTATARRLLRLPSQPPLAAIKFSSYLSSMADLGAPLPPLLLVLCSKSPREFDLALSSKNAGFKLEAVEEEIRVFIQSDLDPGIQQTFQTDVYMGALSTNLFGRLLIWSPRLPSTHDVVSQNFCGIPLGTVCVTDLQFKGRGRSKNVWESPPGCVMFSFTLEMEDGRKLPLLQYVVSLAITEAIKDVCRMQGLPELDVRIKWPNDLYLNGLKVGGILCTSTYRSKKFHVCAGVGLNLDNEKPTTCLNAALKEMIPDSGQIKREDLVAAFFNKFENLFEVFLGQGFQALEELYYQTWLHSCPVYSYCVFYHLLCLRLLAALLIMYLPVNVQWT